jgi:oligopeptide/dipeptide ABC transporter ATP-binding protein
VIIVRLAVGFTKGALVHMDKMLEINHLKKYFKAPNKFNGSVKAVDDVSLHIEAGETLGLVGESGSGKSTLGRTILRLLEPDSGDIIFEGKKINDLKKNEISMMRRKMQIVFQDPFSSLNPRKTVRQILEEPICIHESVSSRDRKDRVIEMLSLVGLDSGYLDRYPHEFSGGQRQRIGIARALMLNPKFIVCDEPVSALDVSVQSQVMNLLCDLQQRFGLTYLFIAHGLNVIKYVSDRVAVMYLGKIIEIGNVKDLYVEPKHPYTMALLSAIATHKQKDQKERIILQGEIPSPVNPPSGCRFSTRCPNVMPICREVEPVLKPISSQQTVACHLYDETNLKS